MPAANREEGDTIEDGVPRRCISEQRAFELPDETAFNMKLEPLLSSQPAGSSDASGVVSLDVDEEQAHKCAEHLQAHWTDGGLKLTERTTCFGYATYDKTLSAQDAEQQRLHTLLFTNTLLPSARRNVPGFFAMEKQLSSWLQKRYDTVVELYSAHGLRQSPHTLQSTGFDVHQDTEDFDDIEYTIVVKLTADEADEPPSAMCVVGAKSDFEYGPSAGASGAFRARLFHASIAPRSEREHLKIAFFFRKSPRGERLAKRSLKARAGTMGEDSLAASRTKVRQRV